MRSVLSFFKATPDSLVNGLMDRPSPPNDLRSLQWLLAQPKTTIQKIADLIHVSRGSPRA